SKDARLAGRTLVGGLVPHAGWTCSGATAAKVLTALKHGTDAPEVIVLFGGVHRYRGRQAAVFGRGEWETPIGSIPVDSRLAERVIGHTNLIVDDPFAHEEEHSLEVQTPFLKHLFPESKILPIMVPIEPRAAEVGQAVARTLQSYRYRAVIVGTTDLTHYGPAYGFVPAGVGRKGNEWAKRENDVRFIELLCRMETDRLVAEAAEHRNACNAGAAAATVAAVKSLGATEGVLLEHTTSAEVLADRVPGEQTDSVGYAGIVYVRNH
ncbi:MAG: AmmeMemoRadiSam system protein B, partial [Planctomycetota bacterium]